MVLQLLWSSKFFNEKIGSGATANVNEVLVQELPKPVIKKFKRGKAYSTFKDNIWAADYPLRIEELNVYCVS